MSVLLNTINELRTHSGRDPLPNLRRDMRLREDLEMDSFALAELTVHLEVKTGTDIFGDGLVDTVGEIEDRLIPKPPNSAYER